MCYLLGVSVDVSVCIILWVHTLCLSSNACVCVFYVSVCAHDAIISHVCIFCSFNVCVDMSLHVPHKQFETCIVYVHVYISIILPCRLLTH